MDDIFLNINIKSTDNNFTDDKSTDDKNIVDKNTEKKPKKIYMDRLFPKCNNVNINNLKIDNESVFYITVPQDSKKIAMAISKQLEIFKDPKTATIIDATAGVGGDSITFCNYFGYVISIEIDDDRFENLKSNLSEYKFDNSTVINSDCIITMPKIQHFDVIYMDPPWGGREYKTKQNLRLTMNNIEIETIIANSFDKSMNLCIPKLFVLKLPKNYDLKYMFDKLSYKMNLYLYEMKKINIIIIVEK